MSKSSLNSSSNPSISSCHSISAIDHDGRVDIKHHSENKALDALDSDGITTTDSNPFNNVPASNSGIENEPSYNLECRKLSVEKRSENQAGYHGYHQNKSSDLIVVTNNCSNHNDYLGQNGSECDSTANSVFSSNSKSNHTTCVVNNVSSHNPSNANSSLKTQKSFKHGSNLRPIMMDDKCNKKEAVKEMKKTH